VEGEDGDAEGDGADDEVLVGRVAAAPEGGVEEHDGDELAGLCEEEGDVVDVGEGGVAKGRGEGGGDGDEEEGEDDAPRREDGGQRGGGAAAPGEVEVARDGGEEGLDRVEEDGVLEDLGLVGGTVGGGCEFLLEEGPGEAGLSAVIVEVGGYSGDIQRSVDATDGNDNLHRASLGSLDNLCRRCRNSASSLLCLSIQQRRRLAADSALGSIMATEVLGRSLAPEGSRLL
jgi:hypothetical protein